MVTPTKIEDITPPTIESRPSRKQKRVTKRLTAQVLYGGKLRRLSLTLDLETNQLKLRPFRCQAEKVYEIVDLYHWGPQLSFDFEDKRANSELPEVKG